MQTRGRSGRLPRMNRSSHLVEARGERERSSRGRDKFDFFSCKEVSLLVLPRLPQLAAFPARPDASISPIAVSASVVASQARLPRDLNTESVDALALPPPGWTFRHLAARLPSRRASATPLENGERLDRDAVPFCCKSAEPRRGRNGSEGRHCRFPYDGQVGDSSVSSPSSDAIPLHLDRMAKKVASRRNRGSRLETSPRG